MIPYFPRNQTENDYRESEPVVNLEVNLIVECWLVRMEREKKSDGLERETNFGKFWVGKTK